LGALSASSGSNFGSFRLVCNVFGPNFTAFGFTLPMLSSNSFFPNPFQIQTLTHLPIPISQTQILKFTFFPQMCLSQRLLPLSPASLAFPIQFANQNPRSPLTFLTFNHYTNQYNTFEPHLCCNPPPLVHTIFAHLSTKNLEPSLPTTNTTNHHSISLTRRYSSHSHNLLLIETSQGLLPSLYPSNSLNSRHSSHLHLAQSIMSFIFQLD